MFIGNVLNVLLSTFISVLFYRLYVAFNDRINNMQIHYPVYLLTKLSIHFAGGFVSIFGVRIAAK